jgi:hypothetical protein
VDLAAAHNAVRNTNALARDHTTDTFGGAHSRSRHRSYKDFGFWLSSSRDPRWHIGIKPGGIYPRSPPNQPSDWPATKDAAPSSRIDAVKATWVPV